MRASEPAAAPVRHAVATDADAIVALWEEAGLTRPWNPPHADVALALSSPSSTVLVVEADGALVATAMAGSDGHRGWVYSVAVATARRGEGFGRSIIRAAESWLAATGVRKVQLMIRDGNPVEAFYEGLGY